MIQRFLNFLISMLIITSAVAQSYPQQYFRHPLNIRMELVANFGEIRTNHWHMGLDIRTQQRVNLPVYASADGYIGRIVVEPGGFGQAIYINHPNGFTTLYAHLNAFYAPLAKYITDQQYAKQSWKVDLTFPPDLFPVKKGQQIGLSGSTGGSQGPHVHFEIRDTKTDKVLNPLLFKMPIADAVAPSIIRLAMYDRNKSTYSQSPQLLAVTKSGSNYTLAAANIVKVGSDKISFAVGAVDRLSGSSNPNGIYCAEIEMDGKPVSGFKLDRIDYNESRYINAQLDYPYQIKTGVHLQHISPLPGATAVAYQMQNADGTIRLTDGAVHDIVIHVYDANNNSSNISFKVQYSADLQRSYAAAAEQLLPNNVNVFERPSFELFTTEATIYDTVNVSYSNTANTFADAASDVHTFLNTSIPVHDYVTVRIKPTKDLSEDEKARTIIRNVSGSRTYVQKVEWKSGSASAKFRQFGTYQLLVDDEPPTVNAPPANLTKSSRIVFTPKDNNNSIKNFRVELDGKWLRFTNDKGKTWIYRFDSHFPKGAHELKVIIEDEAGNVTTKTWNVHR